MKIDAGSDEMENCTAWKSGTARKSSPNLVTKQAKAKEEGEVKLTGDVSAVDALATSEQIAEPKLTSIICAQGKSVGNCEDEKTETSQNVPVVTIDLGSLRYCQTTVMRWMEMNPHLKPQN